MIAKEKLHVGAPNSAASLVSGNNQGRLKDKSSSGQSLPGELAASSYLNRVGNWTGGFDAHRNCNRCQTRLAGGAYCISRSRGHKDPTTGSLVLG
jgi:hypothetical protein